MEELADPLQPFPYDPHLADLGSCSEAEPEAPRGRFDSSEPAAEKEEIVKTQEDGDSPQYCLQRKVVREGFEPPTKGL